MFCPNCGTNLADDSKFCGVCGTNISEVTSQEIKEEIVNDRTNSASKEEQPKIIEPKKKINTKKWMGICVSVACVFLLIVLFSIVIKGFGKSSNAYVYLSDGKYELITNLKKNISIEVSSAKSDDIEFLDSPVQLVSFSPDGKYIYYYTKYDDYEGTGSLCRAEYGKLKENSNKNDKYIQIIATNVQLGFSMLEDGTLLYKNGESNLYCYNGEESSQIAKSINYYYADSSNRVIYTIGNYSDGYTLYGVDLNNITNKIKLATNYTYLCNYVDFENITYVKEEDDGSGTLYIVGFEKESEKLAKDVTVVFSDEERVMFISDSGKSLSLYDYVEDEYESNDAGITEPNQYDYEVPTYSYYMISDSDVSEENYGELYTSCTRALYLYGESTWWSYSMEDALDRTWGDNTDALHASTQKFIDKFSGMADENGYILVTDEVKSALKEIVKTSDAPENDWKWLWLCFSKEQSGTEIDYGAYYEAYDIYNEAAARIELRQALQDKENEYKIKSLCCFEGGKINTISDKVLSWGESSTAIVYNTTDTVIEKENINGISSIYDVRELFEINEESKNYIVSEDGSYIYEFSANAMETAMDFEEVYFVDKNLYACSDDGLYFAEIEKNVLESFNIITDDADVVGIEEDVLYYMNNIYDNNDYSYGDLYMCKNGKSTCMVKDIMTSGIRLYTDGVIIAGTGYRSSHGFELTMIQDNGETSIIAEDVTQSIRVDKSHILYISDGDLYSYNGEERTLLREDVSYFWSKEFMEFTSFYRYY